MGNSMKGKKLHNWIEVLALSEGTSQEKQKGSGMGAKY